MEVILLQEVDNLGDPGQIIKVKNGYARNYLLPKKIAVKKSKTSLEILEKQKDEFAKIIAEKKSTYQQIIDKLKGLEEIKIETLAGEDGKLFGTITNQNIAEHLSKEYQIDIDRKKITLKDHIKMTGSYSVTVNLNQEYKCDLTFEVIKGVA